MSLRIIYGTAGTGKSEAIFQEIQEKIKSHSKYPITIITPEQFSFTAEQKLLDTSPSHSIIQAEVVTFARMAYRILNEVGGKTKTHLSSSGRAILIDYILLTQKERFSFLGKSDENVEMMARQLTELKKHMVTSEKLEEVIANTQEEYLKRKLQDITKLYESYIEKIQSNYIDENDGLTILATQLEESTQFQNHDIYIDEFAGFTLQEYEILRKLMKLSHQMTITICTDNLEENTNPDTDIFYANKQTAKRILEIAKQEQVIIDNPICLKDEVNKNIIPKAENTCIKNNKRFKNPELKHLAENSKGPFYTKYENQVENISLFLANNPYSEIEHVAIEITKLIQKGYRYEEIAVITKNIPQYASLCRAIFRQYQIPVFIDEKKDLGDNFLATFILSLLEIFSQNWSYEAIFGLIKTGLYHLDEQEIAILENYCLKWGIKGSKWYAKDWNFYDETEEQQKQILYAKEQVVQPLLKFKKTLQGLKTVKEITSAIYYFLIENEVDKKLLEKIYKLEESQNKNLKETDMLNDEQQSNQQEINSINKNNQQEINNTDKRHQRIINNIELNSQGIQREYETSFQILMDLLDEIVLVLGDETITFERYAKILKMGLNQTDLGTIPATLDQVIVRRCRQIKKP